MSIYISFTPHPGSVLFVPCEYSIRQSLNDVNMKINISLNKFSYPLDYIQQILYNIEKGMKEMTIEQKIKMALAYSGISQAELARRIGTSPSNLNQKIKRNTLTMEDMEKIADALGGMWKAEFVFPGGTVI